MFIIKPLNNKAVWEKFLLNSDQVNFLQSFAWGETHQSLKHPVLRFGIYSKDKLIGLIQLIKVAAKRGTYWECPGGPVLDFKNERLLEQAINFLKELAKKEKVLWLRIRPNVPESLETKAALKRLGFVKAPMHLHAENTLIIDLNQSLDKLLANMRKNTRYAVRQAEKLGVKVVTENNLKAVEELYRLQLKTAKRHHFVPFSLPYLKAQFEAFSKDNQIQIFKAVYQGRVLALAMIIFYGPEAVYHYSGSSEESRRIPGSYLLQWVVIQAAKLRGSKRYNLWGIDPHFNPKHRFAGVTLFKTGFGGTALNYMPAHDLPFSFYYWPNYLFETLRRKLRRL